MADVQNLERTLAETLYWNRARINFLAKFIVGLIQVRTVNLSEIANSFSGKAKESSNYKRIQRFLSGFEISYQMIAILIVKLIKQEGPWILSLDRTNWKLGKSNLNVLMLGIVYKGIAFPIFWQLLDKQGNSNTKERKAIINQFIQVFGVSSILYLCADREFVGKDWFRYLKRNKIDFRIRIRANTLIPNVRGEQRNAWQLFASARINEVIVLQQQRTILSVPLYFSGMKLKGGEYLIIASLNFSANPVKDYANRWGIETLFGCLKSRGFRLEETHITDLSRIKKLIGLLAIAFCWAHLVGQWLASINPIKIKKHGRPAKSIFRLGFDFLRRIFINFFLPDFIRVCRFLSCT